MQADNRRWHHTHRVVNLLHDWTTRTCPPPAPPAESPLSYRPSSLHSIAGRKSPAITAALLLLWCALLPADGATPVIGDGNPGQEIEYPEGAVSRILTLPAGNWHLSGPDAARFRLEADALRFVARPDFETPTDMDSDNRYQVTVHRTGEKSDHIPVTVRVSDRNEPGHAMLQSRRPIVGETVTIQLTDPDRADSDPSPLVRWQRWQAPGEWQPVPQSGGLHYTPTAADVGHPLRADISYSDRHGTNQQAAVELPHPVLGPMLLTLEARTNSSKASSELGDTALRPAFHPRMTHYGLPCNERDVMTVSFTAPPDAHVSVNGIQPAPGTKGASAVSVTPVSDVTVTVAAPNGAWTAYTIHCMPPRLWKIRPEPDPEQPLAMQLGVTRGPWVAVIDEHGVSRAHLQAEGNAAGFFLRPFGAGPHLQWVHASIDEGEGPAARPWPEALSWKILNRDFVPLRTVSTGAPLTTTGRHDFQLLEDGSTLLMTYEPSVRDLRTLAFSDNNGKPFGAAVKMEDSAIQLQGPDGTVRWTWNSWNRLPLEDCAQHWFPGDWAHVNSLQWTDQGVLASFRGCSTVVMLDPNAAPGAEIVWRLGVSNLAADDWAHRGLGPPPLRIVGDPDGEFCGQHAAQLLPPPAGLTLPRLLLFDNGVACVIDPHTGKPLGRQPGIYSRAVEYALDLEHGEAIFVRDHALRGSRDMLGRAGGHVEPLPDGDWLISWGGPGRVGTTQVGRKLPVDSITRVDPDTGMESFRIPAAGSGMRALPVSPFATMQAPQPLAVVLSDVPPAGHAGAADRVQVTVAFSRPVAAFGRQTGSISVTGGVLTSAAPLTGFGRPAHAWQLVLTPSDDRPLQLAFKPGVACTGQTAGICTIDGQRLHSAPDTITIPRLTPQKPI